MKAHYLISVIAFRFLAGAILTGEGCIATRQMGTQMTVPFIPQSEQNHCGSTCLAMALVGFNIPFQMQDLAQASFVPALSGSTPELLADVAETYGLKASIRSASMEEIDRELQKGTIAVAFLPPEQNQTVGHFVLITGVSINHRQLRAHDGERKNQWISTKPLNNGPPLPLLTIFLTPPLQSISKQ